MLALGAAALIAIFEILDDTFKSPEQIEEQIGLSVLGMIPFADGDVLAEIRVIKPIGGGFSFVSHRSSVLY